MKSTTFSIPASPSSSPPTSTQTQMATPSCISTRRSKASGRLAPYVSAGMAKTKPGIGVDIGGTDETTAANFVKNNGYAAVMTYNISTTSQTNLGKVTKALYGKSTSVTANCLQ
jgi:hypothetical protein